MTIHDRVRAACNAQAAAAAAAAAGAAAGATLSATAAGPSDPSAAAPPAAAPPSASPANLPSAVPQSSTPSRCRTLIFDSGHDGFGDTVFGVASTFVAALLDDRAFLMRQEWLQFAFEPATFDWRDTRDIPLTEPSPQIMDENTPPDAPYARLSLYNRNVTDPEALFGKLSGIAHIGLVWNRGILFNLLTKGKGAWADKFTSIGVTPPYAFACAIRFLLRPKPEVWQLMRGISQQVHVPNSISIGIHIRVRDGIAWEDVWHDGVPKVLNGTVVEELYNENKQAFECAQVRREWGYERREEGGDDEGEKEDLEGESSEGMGLLRSNSSQASFRMLGLPYASLNVSSRISTALPPPTPPTSLPPLPTSLPPPLPPPLPRPLSPTVLTPNSTPLCPLQIVTTEFIPRHVAISKEPNSTAHTAPPAWYQETVAEWLLLASTHLLIIPAESGFSRSAVMYSMRPGGVYMPHKCRPDAPVPVGDLAVVGCGV
ncbi:unnamed protein product [Closterium sp. Naga37s-1]|nr:unnamed protein product [Closterium sp. Naga37s-1]